MGEQEALGSTLQFFEERFAKLEGLEYYQERRLKGLGLLDEDGEYAPALCCVISIYKNKLQA